MHSPVYPLSFVKQTLRHTMAQHSHVILSEPDLLERDFPSCHIQIALIKEEVILDAAIKPSQNHTAPLYQSFSEAIPCETLKNLLFTVAHLNFDCTHTLLLKKWSKFPYLSISPDPGYQKASQQSH